MPATVEFTGDIARLILSGDFDFSTQENLSEAIEMDARAPRLVCPDNAMNLNERCVLRASGKEFRFARTRG